MKKVISSILCLAIVCSAVFAGTFSAFAASSEQTKRYTIATSKTINIPDNELRVYTSGLTKESCTGSAELASDNESWTVETKECIDNYKVLSTSAGKDYRIGMSCGGITSISSNVSRFDKTGGKYEWVRFKIYDFTDESCGFNEDGTLTKKFFDDIHTYDFTCEDYKHISMMMIISGAAVTVAAPDKDGYVEAYVSKNLGDYVWLKTYCKFQTIGVGGGVQTNLLAISIGDTDQNGSIGISDATEIQKYIAETAEFDSLSKRAADANGDGKIDVEDVTAIQKYIAVIKK